MTFIFKVEKFRDVTLPRVKRGLYMVSDHGTVINKLTKRVKSQHSDTDGYKRVVVMIEGNDHRVIGVHRLVAWEFCEGYTKEKHVVNHKDGIKYSNKYTNLEWCTPSENNQHAADNGLVATGEKHHWNVYSEQLIRIICELISEGLTQGEIYNLIYKFPDVIGKEKSRIINLIKDLRRRKVWSRVAREYDY